MLSEIGHSRYQVARSLTVFQFFLQHGESKVIDKFKAVVSTLCHASPALMVDLHGVGALGRDFFVNCFILFSVG